jgi:hypothetical protein
VVVDQRLDIPDGTDVLILPAANGVTGSGSRPRAIDLSQFAVDAGPPGLASHHDHDAWNTPESAG